MPLKRIKQIPAAMHINIQQIWYKTTIPTEITPKICSGVEIIKLLLPMPLSFKDKCFYAIDLVMQDINIFITLYIRLKLFINVRITQQINMKYFDNGNQKIESCFGYFIIYKDWENLIQAIFRLKQSQVCILSGETFFNNIDSKTKN